MLYARDTSGRLWGFEGKPYSPENPYKDPFLIGAGWNVYTAITPLISAQARHVAGPRPGCPRHRRPQLEPGKPLDRALLAFPSEHGTE